MSELLEDVRLWLRKSSNAFDSEIQQTIDAALDDMEGAGVEMPGTRLKEGGIRQAVKLFAKANFGYGDPDGIWQSRYEKLRDALASRRTYRGGAGNG